MTIVYIWTTESYHLWRDCDERLTKDNLYHTSSHKWQVNLFENILNEMILKTESKSSITVAIKFWDPLPGCFSYKNMGTKKQGHTYSKTGKISYSIFKPNWQTTVSTRASWKDCHLGQVANPICINKTITTSKKLHSRSFTYTFHNFKESVFFRSAVTFS